MPHRSVCGVETDTQLWKLPLLQTYTLWAIKVESSKLPLRPNPFSAPCNRCRYLEFQFLFLLLFYYERTRTFVLCENMAPLLQARCSVGKCNIPLLFFFCSWVCNRLRTISRHLQIFRLRFFVFPFIWSANVYYVWK